MRTVRDVYLTIGKKSYSISTPLENEEIDQVKSLIDEACGGVSRSADQEELLMLTCMRLAYSLCEINKKLQIISDRLEKESRGGN
ncbi:MAG: cell division protein ZapA [Synergistaceae bacterium]|nr:cell division protein ZapA [Synergistaceae bacterium]